MLFSHLKVTIHAQGQAPTQRHSDCYSRKIYTASASGKSDCNPDKPETLGSSDSLAAPNPCAGGRRKTDGSQKPIHNFKDRTHGIYPAGENRCFKERPKRNCPLQPPLRIVLWWRRSGSNRRPSACKADALPTELRPRKWWAWVDSNYRPHAYQACALTD